MTTSKFKSVSTIRDPEARGRTLAQVAESALSTRETEAVVAMVKEGKEPELAATEMVNERESKKPTLRHQTPVRCKVCATRLYLSHNPQSGKHNLVERAVSEK